MALPNIGKAVVGGVTGLVRNATAGVLAAATLPFAYGGLLLRNQLNTTLQMNNPLNYLQGVTNILNPVSGEFTRQFNQFGGGRQKPMQPPPGTDGNVDITPIVAELVDLKQITSGQATSIARLTSSTQNLLVTNQTTQKAIVNQGNLLTASDKKLLTLTQKQQELINADKEIKNVLIDHSKLIGETNKLLIEQTEKLMKLNGSNSAANDRNKALQALQQVIEMAPKDVEEIKKTLDDIKRQERIQSGAVHSILISLERQERNGVEVNRDPFDNLMKARDADDQGNQLMQTANENHPTEEKKENPLLAALTALGGFLLGGLGTKLMDLGNLLLTPLRWIGGILTSSLSFLTRMVGGLLGGAGRLLGGVASGIGNAAMGAVRGVGRFLGIGAEGAEGAAAVGARGLARFIPGVGAAISGGMAINNFAHGNWIGGTMNAAAAGLSFVPGLGWVAAAGLDAASGLTNANMSSNAANSASQMWNNTFGGNHKQPAPTQQPHVNDIAQRTHDQQQANARRPIKVIQNHNNVVNNNGQNNRGNSAVIVELPLPDRTQKYVFSYVD